MKYFLILPKRTKPLRPYVFVINNQKGRDSYLLGNLALYIPHRAKPGFEPTIEMLKNLQVL